MHSHREKLKYLIGFDVLTLKECTDALYPNRYVRSYHGRVAERS